MQIFIDEALHWLKYDPDAVLGRSDNSYTVMSC